MAKFEDFENNSEQKDKLPNSGIKVAKNPYYQMVEPSLNTIKETRQYAPAELYRESPYGMNLSILQQNLGNCLQIIDDEVMKGYITKLDTLPIVKMDSEFAESLNDIHFFKITELVYQDEEFSVHKLATVFHALSNKPCTLVLMIKSDGLQNHFYLGTRAGKGYSSGTMMQMLKQSLLGLFPGSRIENYYDKDMKKDFEESEAGCISSVTCVADYKQDESGLNNSSFVQGLEKFIYSMQGKKYKAVFIANNLSHDALQAKRKEFESIYTQISPFANMQMNFTRTDTDSISASKSMGETQTATYGLNQGKTSNIGLSNTRTEGNTETYGSTDTHGTSESQSDGTTDTKGYSDGTTTSESNSHTTGTSVGVAAGIPGTPLQVSANRFSSDTRTLTQGTSHTDTVSNSISKTLTHGISDSHADSNTYGTNESESRTKTYGIGTTSGESYSVGNSFNLVNSETLTNTFGSSQGITLNANNMTLSSTMQRIEKNLQRLDECESLGMWDFAAYFLGESAAETETAANTYQSVVSGIESGIERAAVNSWVDEESLELLSDYIRNFLHPEFMYERFNYDGNENVFVNPTAMVSTNELAIHMGLPRHSVRGLPVIEHAVFAQEVLSRNSHRDRSLYLGDVYHLGETSQMEVELDVDSLAMHTFVTGSTGSGKSNAVYHILSEAEKKQIPFLVVEPAKGEYRNVFKYVRCFSTNPNIGQLLRINPFSFPKEIHILEHIDRIIELFNVCWPMYAAMPAVLKESVEQAYVTAGWDLDLSVNTKVEGLFPTFEDVLVELNNTINNSAYAADTKGDYIGSLSTRIKSLTNGINGRIFVGNEMDLSVLFDESAILDISRVGSMETKSLIMGLIVLKLQEYRMANATGMNEKLKHITVLEEAHNLLKKTSTEQSQDSSNLQGKAVEMLANTIAEIRTYGEGFIIVDQAPNMLDTAAIRNTNTKIVLRLPEGNDRELTGAAMALNEKQTAELSKLPTGVAAVYQNDWQEALLCKLPQYKCKKSTEEIIKDTAIAVSDKEKNNQVLHELLKNVQERIQSDKLKENIMNLNLSAQIRKDLIHNLESGNLYYEWAVADFINKKYKLQNVFQGTRNGDWNTLEQLGQIMMLNVKDEFEGFDDVEMMRILYYICRIQHEKFPENRHIEQLRLDHLKKFM